MEWAAVGEKFSDWRGNKMIRDSIFSSIPNFEMKKEARLLTVSHPAFRIAGQAWVNPWTDWVVNSCSRIINPGLFAMLTKAAISRSSAASFAGPSFPHVLVFWGVKHQSLVSWFQMTVCKPKTFCRDEIIQKNEGVVLFCKLSRHMTRLAKFGLLLQSLELGCRRRLKKAAANSIILLFLRVYWLVQLTNWSDTRDVILQGKKKAEI